MCETMECLTSEAQRVRGVYLCRCVGGFVRFLTCTTRWCGLVSEGASDACAGRCVSWRARCGWMTAGDWNALSFAHSSCVSCAPDPCGVSKGILPPHRLGDGSNLGPCPRIRGPFGVRSQG
jgi:hypothetical protein